jgi:hypothetical protein
MNGTKNVAAPLPAMKKIGKPAALLLICILTVILNRRYGWSGYVTDPAAPDDPPVDDRRELRDRGARVPRGDERRLRASGAFRGSPSPSSGGFFSGPSWERFCVSSRRRRAPYWPFLPEGIF